MPMLKVIAENAKCKYIQVINFPGVENTKTLEDIFEYNAAQFMKAFGKFSYSPPRGCPTACCGEKREVTAPKPWRRRVSRSAQFRFVLSMMPRALEELISNHV